MQALADRAEIVRARVPISTIVGADVSLTKQGREWAGLCPFHHDTKLGSFFANDDKAIFKCFACGASGDVLEYVTRRTGRRFVDVLSELERDAGIDFTDAKAKAVADDARRKRERQALRDADRRRGNAQALWIEARPLRGSPAQSYLERRGIDFAKLGRFPGAIRFRDELMCGEAGRALPAMVTAIQATDGTFLGVHRTWLAFDGRGWAKAKLDKPKMVLGDFAGGAMPIWKGTHRVPLQRVPAGMVIALSEGIEDALSVAMATPDLRVLAAVSLDNIGNVALPVQAGDLVILGQRDGDVRQARAAAALAAGDAEEAEKHEKVARQIAGQLERAIGAQQAKAREAGSSRAVRVAWPAPGFKDFNDELVGKRMGAA